MRLFIFLALIPFLTQAQDTKVFQILSKQTGMQVRDAYILLDEKVSGISDEQGYFEIKTEDFKVLQIKHLNFLEKSITYQELIKSKKIYLEEKNETLDEVLISKDIRKIKRILPKKSLRSKLAFNKGLQTLAATVYVTYLPNELKEEVYINKILTRPTKKQSGDPNKQYMPYLVNLYSVDTITGLPKDKLINKTHLVARKKGDKDKYVEVDIREHNIKFPKEGIYVAIETLTNEEYKNFFNISRKPPGFDALDKHKITNSISYNRWLNSDGSIKFDWLDKRKYDTLYIFNFGIEVELN